MKELLIQPLPGIGDMVWHLPAIHAIAAANSSGRIDILTKRRSLADRLLAADPAVGEVLWVERDGRHRGISGLLVLTRELRQKGYQRVWVLHGSARYALAGWLAGIPERLGYGAGIQKWCLDRAAVLSREQMHLHPFDKASAVVTRAGLTFTETEPLLVIDAEQAAEVRRLHAERPAPWYALGIGSSEAEKQWGGEKFTALAGHLLTRGGTCFLIGGPAESELAASIVSRAPAQRERLVVTTRAPIDEVAALLSWCRIYIGNDTGALNIAAAVGLPCIGLFGGSMPLRHSPRIHCLVPEKDVDVHREGTGVYGAGERGMAAIGVEQVLRALEEELGREAGQ